MDDWPAMKKWELDTLRRNYRTAKFKVGEKDNGDKIRLKMVRLSAGTLPRMAFTAVGARCASRLCVLSSCLYAEILHGLHEEPERRFASLSL